MRAIQTLLAPLRALASDPIANPEGRGRPGRGAFNAFAIRVVAAGVLFVSQVLLARWMGAHDFGVFTYVWVLINVVGTLCALGFATSVNRFLPQYQALGQLDRARGLLLSGRAVSFAAGAVAMAAGLVLLYGRPELVEESFRLPLAFGLLCLPAYALTDFHDGAGRTQGWLVLALAPPFVVRPLLLIAGVGVAGLLGAHASAEIAVLAASAATWITFAGQSLLLSRRLRPIIPPGPRRYELGHWLAVSLPVLLLDGFALMMTNLDILLLELFVTPDQIGIYFAAARIISLIAFVHFAVTAAAMPRFAELHARGDRAAITALLHDTRKWTLLPSLAAASALLLLGKPLLWLFGPEFTDSYAVMFVLVIGLLVQAAVGPALGLLVVTGRHNLAAAIMGSTVVVNGSLNLLLIPVYGLMGAAAATSTALAVQSLMLFLAVRSGRVSGTALAPGGAHGAAAE